MANKPRHGHAVIGERSRLHYIWTNMKQRCSNPNATGYSDYGGRGISICQNWNNFDSFLIWAKSSGYTDNLKIERRDVNGNYEPSNCYWADDTIQACNKRKRINSKSQYIGVAPNKNNWQCYVDYKGKRVNLGTYTTEIEAAQVRDQYIKDNGLPHKLNF